MDGPFIQIKGSNKEKVAAAGLALNLEGTYTTMVFSSSNFRARSIMIICRMLIIDFCLLLYEIKISRIWVISKYIHYYQGNAIHRIILNTFLFMSLVSAIHWDCSRKEIHRRRLFLGSSWSRGSWIAQMGWFYIFSGTFDNYGPLQWIAHKQINESSVSHLIGCLYWWVSDILFEGWEQHWLWWCGEPHGSNGVFTWWATDTGEKAWKME